MANTYSQMSIQAIFAVKGRENIITSNWRDDFHKYIAGINPKESTLLAVGDGKTMSLFLADFRKPCQCLNLYKR